MSCWLKHHFPAAFTAALLNSQPMGFYAPAQLVRDAQAHGVEVRGVDVNYSDWDSTLEPMGSLRETSLLGGPRKAPTDVPPRFAIRLGMRQIGGLRQDAATQIVAARDMPYRDIKDLHVRAGLTAPIVRRLAEADAARSLWIDRRQALWDAKGLRDAPDLPLFQNGTDEGTEVTVPLPVMPVCEQVVADYQTLRLSLKAHPISFLRRSMTRQGYKSTADLARMHNRQRIKIAGLVLIRQRPGSAKGVCFITLEDEFGVANLVVWPKVMETFRKAVMQSRLLSVEGYIQRDADIVHVVAMQLTDRSDALLRLAPEAMPTTLARVDHVTKPLPASGQRHPRDVRIVPKSRDFH